MGTARPSASATSRPKRFLKNTFFNKYKIQKENQDNEVTFFICRQKYVVPQLGDRRREEEEEVDSEFWTLPSPFWYIPILFLPASWTLLVKLMVVGAIASLQGFGTCSFPFPSSGAILPTELVQ
jgi:hypothetical protein